MAENLSEGQRRLRARLAAHSSWARTEDPVARTAPARRAAFQRFVELVDPDGKLSEADRTRRAEHARRAFLTRIAYESARVRRARREARRDQTLLDDVRNAIEGDGAP